MKLEGFEEQVFFSTVRITIQDEQGVGASIGTGFILKIILSDGDAREVTLLISNKHVFVDPSNHIILNFHKKKDDSWSPELGQIITMHGKITDIYREHPDPRVDLACIDISDIAKPESGIYYRNLFTDMICDFRENELIPGKNVMVRRISRE